MASDDLARGHGLRRVAVPSKVTRGGASGVEFKGPDYHPGLHPQGR